MALRRTINRRLGLRSTFASLGPLPIYTPLPYLYSVDVTPIVHAEGNSGSTAFVCTIYRWPMVGATTCDWAVQGTGTYPANDQDFVGNALPFGTQAFADGDGMKQVTVLVSGDTTYETDKTFQFSISNGTNPDGSAGSITDGSVLCTIANEDSPPAPEFALSTLSLSQNEGNSGTTAWQVYLNRNLNTVGPATAYWAISSDPSHPNPAQPSDFPGGNFPTGSVTYASGDTTKPINWSTVTDTTASPDKGYLLTITSVSVGAVASGQDVCHCVSLNDDAAPTFTLQSGIAYNGLISHTLKCYPGYNNILGRATFGGATQDIHALGNGKINYQEIIDWWEAQPGGGNWTDGPFPVLSDIWQQSDQKTGNFIQVGSTDMFVLDPNNIRPNGLWPATPNGDNAREDTSTGAAVTIEDKTAMAKGSGTLPINTGNFGLLLILGGVSNIGTSTGAENSLIGLQAASSANNITLQAGDSDWSQRYGYGALVGPVSTGTKYFPATANAVRARVNPHVVLMQHHRPGSGSVTIDGVSTPSVHIRVNGDASQSYTAGTGATNPASTSNTNTNNIRINQRADGTADTGGHWQFYGMLNAGNAFYNATNGDQRPLPEAEALSLFGIETAFEHQVLMVYSSSGVSYRDNMGLAEHVQLNFEGQGVSVEACARSGSGAIATIEPNFSHVVDCIDTSLAGEKIVVIGSTRSDIINGKTADEIFTSYMNMVASAKAGGATQVVVTSFYRNITSGISQATYDAVYSALRAKITDPVNVAANGYVPCDTGSIPELQDFTNKTYFAGDGIHLRRAGLVLHAAYINQTLTSLLFGATIPTLQPGAAYTGALDSGGYTPPAVQMRGSGNPFPAVASMSIPYEMGTKPSAFGQTARLPQSDGTWWFESTADNYVTVSSDIGDLSWVESVTFVLEGASVTLTGDQLWQENPTVPLRDVPGKFLRGATIRVESSPTATSSNDCRARLYAIVKPFNGEDRIISTVICLNTDGRFVRPERYVDPVNGSDSNAGTLAAPWKTLSYWLNRASGSSGVPNGGIVYCRTANEYTLGAIASAGGGWSGTMYISVRAWPGETNPILIGMDTNLPNAQNFVSSVSPSYRITAKVLWENTTVYIENMRKWGKGHFFIKGSRFTPRSGTIMGPYSLGYPEGYIKGVNGDGSLLQPWPFEDCGFFASRLAYPNPVGWRFMVGSTVEFGVDANQISRDDHTCGVASIFRQDEPFEYRAHSSVNVTVASVQANTPSAGRTKITFNEPLLDTAEFGTGFGNTSSFLRVLAGGGGVAVGNKTYASDGRIKGWEILQGSANLNAAGRFCIVEGNLAAIAIGATCRIYTPGHCDTTQAIEVDASTANIPREGNYVFSDSLFDCREVQAPHFIQGSASNGTAGFYTATLAGYSITTVGAALTLNLAVDDATRPWAGSGNAALKLRFRVGSVIRMIINGTAEYRRIIAKASATSYTLDAAFPVDLTNDTTFKWWDAYCNYTMQQCVVRVRDPGPLRGTLVAGNHNFIYRNLTIAGKPYHQFVSGVDGCTMFNSLFCATIASSLYPRNRVFTNNHFDTSTQQVATNQNTDGSGSVGSVTYDANFFPTAGAGETVGPNVILPYDFYGNPRISTSPVGAVADIAGP